MDEPDENSASGSKYFSMPLIQLLSLAACVYPIYIGYHNNADPEPLDDRRNRDLRSRYYALGESDSSSSSDSDSDETNSDTDTTNEVVLTTQSKSQEKNAASKMMTAASILETEKKRKRKKKRKNLIDGIENLKLNPGLFISPKPYIPKIEQLYYHDGVLVNPQRFEVIAGTANAKPWMNVESEYRYSRLYPQIPKKAQSPQKEATPTPPAQSLKHMPMPTTCAEEAAIARTKYTRKLSAAATPFVSAQA